jgi:aryl-alcohol dehydrogenase-like predicted oxidoreductase
MCSFLLCSALAWCGVACTAEILQRAAELGVNFIDTANIYEGYTRSAGSKGEAAEIIIGRA